MNYILSILIPTKNRKEYLLKCVSEVSNYCSRNIQIIIQDNSDDPLQKKEIEQFESDNIEYYYKKGDISFVENFSRALKNAKGEYVCFIGDDDGVTPLLEKIVYWMKSNNIDAVSQNISATYFWPNMSIHGNENGLLRLYYANCSVIKKETKPELRKLFSYGCQGYLSRGLVKPYHGIVKKEYFDIILKKTGTYINGLSPDIYASVALSQLIDYVYIVNIPLTISGISPKSGGAASANGSHTGSLKDAPHFKGHSNYLWNDLVPKIYSVETIWADSALHAANDMKMENINYCFNKEVLYKICNKKYPQFSEVYKDFKIMYPLEKHKLFMDYYFNNLKDFISRGINRVFRKKDDYVSFDHVNDIENASELITDFLEENDLTLEKTIFTLNQLIDD